MKNYIKEITYNEILAINGGSRFKADKVVEYYTQRNNLVGYLGMDPTNTRYAVNWLEKEDLKYKAIHFEPPIGQREWIAWGFLALSIISNLILALISK